ncbi:MAG TPA: thiamine pyrophosphate-dependent dehydrogenase E1 component subunit alpha [Dehalococcoidia bacterium]|nr:thiamine pyrophosphate-dependent dehydrogenase E1 component subunit alpha [Dehalococcoidia bacterium]
MSLPREELLALYEKMALIRGFEETMRQEMEAGRLRTYGHLYAGEEAVAVGVGSHLLPQDYIAISYRGHGHSIVRGTDINGMMAELFGRSTGTNKGKGGSMHIADITRGVVTANVMVGFTIPYAVGAALSLQVRKQSGAIAVAYFGDGAVNQGVFHEGLNMAAMWRLPVLFVCENNGYAQATPVEYSVPVPIMDRAAAYNIPSAAVDGMDVFAVYETAGVAAALVRNGGGPYLIEARTYRYSGHYVGDNTLTYRSREEEERYRQRDPLLLFRQRVLDEEMLAAGELDAVDARVKERLQEALRFAAESPAPGPDEFMSNVYASYP